MRTRKLRLPDVKKWLPSLFAAFDLWFPRNSLNQELFGSRIMHAQDAGRTVHYVAVDETCGTVVGIITYNREWTLRHGGAWIVTITEFLVIPEYDTPRVRSNLLHEVIRAAIACQAIAVRYLARQDEIKFFESELWHRPVDRVLMERRLPWERYANLPKRSRVKEDRDG